jgi:hypothetical protein
VSRRGYWKLQLGQTMKVESLRWGEGICGGAELCMLMLRWTKLLILPFGAVGEGLLLRFGEWLIGLEVTRELFVKPWLNN